MSMSGPLAGGELYRSQFVRGDPAVCCDLQVLGLACDERTVESVQPNGGVVVVVFEHRDGAVDADGHAELFEKLALDRGGGGLIGFDLPTGQFPVSAEHCRVVSFAQQHARLPVRITRPVDENTDRHGDGAVRGVRGAPLILAQSRGHRRSPFIRRPSIACNGICLSHLRKFCASERPHSAGRICDFV